MKMSIYFHKNMPKILFQFVIYMRAHTCMHWHPVLEAAPKFLGNLCRPASEQRLFHSL